MKTTMKYILVLGIAALYSATNVYAERLVSDPNTTYPAFYFTLKTAYLGNIATYTDGIQVKDTETDQAYRLFCTDLYTYTSNDFNNSKGAGQVYNPVALSQSIFHTDVQKTQLQSLFDHVYTKAFNADYSVKDSAYANIFQLAVWEIANDTANNLDLRDGDISLLGCSKGSTVLDATLNTLDSWFKAIVDDSWGDIGYAEDRVSLTVFMPEGGNHVSQTFIGVAVAPEPATMLIFGLGIVGAAAARRRRK